MNKIILTLSFAFTFSAFAGHHEVSGFKVSTADFKDNEKESLDGSCTLKRQDWNGEGWYSLYIYDQRDSNFQGTLAIRNIESGIELIASEEINNNCSIKLTQIGPQKKVTEKCDRFAAHGIVSLTTDSDGLIKGIAIEKSAAGVGGHSMPFPYVSHKKINCKF